jgi:hypothetical protein
MDDFLMCVPLISKTTLVAVAETPQSCPGSPSRLKAPTLVCVSDARPSGLRSNAIAG